MSSTASLSNLGVLGLSKRNVLKNNTSDSRICTEKPEQEVLKSELSSIVKVKRVSGTIEAKFLGRQNPLGKNYSFMSPDLEVNGQTIVYGNSKTKRISEFTNDVQTLERKHNLKRASIKEISLKIKKPYQPVPYLESLTSVEKNKTRTICKSQNSTGSEVQASRNEQNGDITTCSPSSKNVKEYWYLNKTTAAILIIQSIYGVLYTAFVRYSAEADGSEMRNSIHSVRGGFTHEDLPSKTAEMFIPLLYIYILLSSKTIEETRSSLGNFSLLFSFGLESTILLLSFFKENKIRFAISIESIIEAECLMVSFTICHLILRRRASLLQLLLLQVPHIQIQILTKYILEHHFKVNDAGMTMLSHVFGSFYGISASFPLGNRRELKLPKKTYTSLSVLLLLMVFLPSVAYVRTSDDAKRRVVIHSVLMMTSSFIIGFPTSSIFNNNRKYSLSKIIEGMIGVSAAMGSVCHLMFDVYGSILVGMGVTIITIALISTIESKYPPNSEEQDVLRVFVRHGLNGIIGGLLSSLLSILASSDIGYYGYSLFKIYPARTPTEGSDELLEVQSYLPIPAGEGRTAFEQGGFQLAGLLVVVLTASVGGLVSGLILRFKIFEGFLEEEEEEKEKEYSSQGKIQSSQ